MQQWLKAFECTEKYLITTPTKEGGPERWAIDSSPPVDC